MSWIKAHGRRVHRHLSPELERKLERTKHRRPHRPEQTHEPKKGGKYKRAAEKRRWQQEA